MGPWGKRRTGRRRTRARRAVSALALTAAAVLCGACGSDGWPDARATLAGATSPSAAGTPSATPGAASVTPSGGTGTTAGSSTSRATPVVPTVPPRPGTSSARRTPQAPRAGALAGKVVVLDPGHQLGNSRHLAEVNRLVVAGPGLRKACNSTGTSTDAGYPESRVAMGVARAAKRRLEALGAEVVLTRHREDVAFWGPCIDARGRTGNRVGADAVVSIHADGAPAGDRGFHVIRPATLEGWTDDVARPSARLATAVHDALRAAGVRPAGYVGSRDGYDVRADLGTLNWSDRPVVMVELGNMRNAADARLLTDPRWQDRVAAAAVSAGLARFAGR